MLHGVIHKEWLGNPDWWFHSTEETDRKVIHMFGPTWEDACQLPVSSWEQVVLYDQLARHFFRNNTAVIEECLEEALAILQTISKEELNTYTPEETIFLLLPYRHTKIPRVIHSAIDMLKEHPAWKSHPPIFLRFYKASITQLATFHDKFTIVYQPRSHEKRREWTDWNTPPCNILEYCPTEEIMPGIMKEIRWPSLKNEETDQIRKVVVSLSGGVDSMVLLHQILAIHCGNVEAVHICYGNRPESMEEVGLLIEYCGRLGVTLTVRYIKEIKRTRDVLRDFYEEITRKIRFEMYQRVANQSEDTPGIVFLGHHEDDALENVWSNIRKGRNWENLRGMSLTHVENGVEVGRPLIALRKNEVLKFAYEHSIPFLEDSTPKWSERGRMRDTLIPFIDNFEQDIHPGMMRVANQFQQLYHIVQTQVWKPFEDSIVWSPTVVEMPYIQNASAWGIVYWQELAVRIARFWSVPYPSRKSVLNLLHILQDNDVETTKIIILSKYISVERRGTRLFFLYKGKGNNATR